MASTCAIGDTKLRNPVSPNPSSAHGAPAGRRIRIAMMPATETSSTGICGDDCAIIWRREELSKLMVPAP